MIGPAVCNSADLLSNRDGDFKHCCVFKHELRNNEPASDTVRGHHQDVLQFHIVRGFQGTTINVISFKPKKKMSTASSSDFW